MDFMHRNSYSINRGYFNYRNKFGGHKTTMKMLLRCPNKYSPHLDGCKFHHNGMLSHAPFWKGYRKGILLGSKKVHGSAWTCVPLRPPLEPALWAQRLALEWEHMMCSTRKGCWTPTFAAADGTIKAVKWRFTIMVMVMGQRHVLGARRICC